MKKLLLSCLFALTTFVQTVDAKTIFSCQTANGKFIKVEKVSPSLYQYSFGKGSKIELSLTNKKSELLGRSTKWDGFGRGRWSTMVFQNGEYLYSVWVNLDSIDHTVESSVSVERKGKVIAGVKCTPDTAQANFYDEDFAW